MLKGEKQKEQPPQQWRVHAYASTILPIIVVGPTGERLKSSAICKQAKTREASSRVQPTIRAKQPQAATAKVLRSDGRSADGGGRSGGRGDGRNADRNDDGDAASAGSSPR